MSAERIYIVVRRDESGEWLDLTTASYHRDEATQCRLRRENDLNRSGSGRAWLRRNPVVRVAACDVTEVT